MKYLNIHQLQVKLGGRSTNAIYGDIQHGKLPKPIKLGNRNLWPEPTVDVWMARLAKEQGADMPELPPLLQALGEVEQ